mmetsp:Transcript_22603/g.35146  ORF Transcript_22603/g.35146 Transcript_22603/m.35146 type:complete len:93 (-) Transcript_22603:201-479(-)|eukprot:CAMPEP_0194276598 /NCGR_PEP_ID=MMETSP0169-20130528/9144_1 /TAXON_ID=218684 /ORGANISM="Corethron pennatum, Strain L29A3" /LENGTH=92 /DNA_ID=CAMNT_0039020347 /DNA_START=142 /DNA_END=420 /DNA_ORIENTATION=-
MARITKWLNKATKLKRKENKKTSEIGEREINDKNNPTDAHLYSENGQSGINDILFMEDDNAEYQDDDIGYCDIFDPCYGVNQDITMYEGKKK